MVMNSESPTNLIAPGTLRQQIERVADQLCLTVGGQFDYRVQLDTDDETLEKLLMLINFVLVTAHQSIEEQTALREKLERQLSEREQIEREVEALRQEVGETWPKSELVGRSPALQKVRQQISVVAPTEATVLVLGQSGTGKELVAREIHRRSQRQDRPLVKVNCASVPRELYESEFFGHTRGAFTGAVRDRAGRFELAHGGTLFLDEVGEIPLDLQSKLLRVLQEGQFERVGEDRTRTTDVRVVAATNRDLDTEVQHGRFREDLYYRLNVFPIEVAPLSRRPEDIPLLAVAFVERLAREMNREAPLLTASAFVELQQYDWPGNVRELQNVIERALINNRGGRLHFDLPRMASSRKPQSVVAEGAGVISEAEMRRLERENIKKALGLSDGKVYGRDGAAQLLGIKPNTLAARVKKLGL
jgi:transcriptional regulator with GAF, ATPase, and Fis domain